MSGTELEDMDFPTLSNMKQNGGKLAGTPRGTPGTQTPLRNTVDNEGEAKGRRGRRAQKSTSSNHDSDHADTWDCEGCKNSFSAKCQAHGM